MRKVLLLLFVFSLYIFSIKAQGIESADKITISELQATSKGDVYFEVSLDGSEVFYTAYEMTLEMPEGLNVVYTDDGEVRVTLRKPSLYPYSVVEEENEDGDIVEVKSYTHSINGTYGVIGERKLKVQCYSSTSKSFTAYDGVLFRVYVSVSPFMKPGEAKITTSNVIFATADEVQYDLASSEYTVNVSAERTLPLTVSETNKWSTCVLPFDASLPEGVSAYTAGEVSGGYLLLNEAASLQAYKPYVIYAENGYSGTLTGTVDPAEYVAVATDGLLNGAIVQQQISEGYVLQNQGSGAMFYNTNGVSFTIPEGKCWLSPSSSGAKSYALMTEATGINGVTAQPFDSDMPVYTLDGKRVANPQSGHIYIVGGRKAIKK